VNNTHTHERRFQGDPDRLRTPDRLARLDVQRVVTLSLEGATLASVLDVGTGTGVFAEAFAAAGLEVAGIDANAEMLAAAAKYVPDAPLREAPAEQLPFADASFDLVFLGLVLHETDDPLAALKEAHRTARRRAAILEWAYRDEPPGPPLAHRLKPEMVADLAAKAGFRQVDATHLAHVSLYRLTP